MGCPSTACRRKRVGFPTRVRVIRHYDVAPDAKNRISLRQSKAKYFHVKALSDGRYLLEPRVWVAPQALSRGRAGGWKPPSRI